MYAKLAGRDAWSDTAFVGVRPRGFGVVGRCKRAGRVIRGCGFDFMLMALVIANWVIRDARKRGRPLCYDYGMFLFFAWPIVAPVYLFQTRGVRAFLTLLWFIAILLVAAIAIGMGSLAVDLLSQQQQ